MTDVLVRLRCGLGGCRQTLLELTEEPADWSVSIYVPGCPRHDGFRRTWWEEVEHRRGKGLDPRPRATALVVTAADLRDAFYRARTRGKTTEETLRRQRS